MFNITLFGILCVLIMRILIRSHAIKTVLLISLPFLQRHKDDDVNFNVFFQKCISIICFCLLAHTNNSKQTSTMKIGGLSYSWIYFILCFFFKHFFKILLSFNQNLCLLAFQLLLVVRILFPIELNLFLFVSENVISLILCYIIIQKQTKKYISVCILYLTDILIFNFSHYFWVHFLNVFLNVSAIYFNKKTVAYPKLEKYLLAMVRI